MPSRRPRQTRSPQADRRRWIALVVVCLAMFMNSLDGSIVNVALPAIQQSLHFSQSGLTWVVDAYLISFGSFLLMAGRLGDLVGRKKIFLAGVTLFTARLGRLRRRPQPGHVGRRALRPGHRRRVVVLGDRGHHRHRVPAPLERAKAMSAYVFVAVGGGSIGLLAGGILTQVLNWHWIFFVNVPIGIATLVPGSVLLVENVGFGIRQGVDWVGLGPGDRRRSW